MYDDTTGRMQIMNESKKEFYRIQAETIINKLKLRKMEGYYCDNAVDAGQKVLELIGEPSKTIGLGGSVTVKECGIRDAVIRAGHKLIVPQDYKTEAEIKEYKALTVNADYFLMSTNAITLDGELVNIDGRGNRLSFMIYGPENVIIVAGMNKVVANVEEGISRVHTMAAPPNTVRLGCDTPCSKSGVCGNCINNTICCQAVVTRASRVPGRIKVILVGEELGY